MSYPRFSAIELHHDGEWHAVGDLRVIDHGHGDFTYRDEYVFGALKLPVTLTRPVSIEPPALVEGPLGKQRDLRLPAFLYDMVPQGRGRRYLLDMLQLPDSDGIEAALLLKGAFSPIGALRLASAVEFYEQEARKVNHADQKFSGGFDLEDMYQNSEHFVEHLALHSMLASGTTGVQGVAPKFLLASDKNGRYFADMALSDSEATAHWLAKLPRGRTEEDLLVHRNEASYLRLAYACGLRTNEPPQLIGNILLLRRFDRVHSSGKLHRLHQESVASLCGLRGFGLKVRQQDILKAIRRVVHEPLQESIEFIRRDVLNLAMRNTDNHARNTAVQRTADGVVQLTPVYDFSPMFKDPEMIARTCHWESDAGARLPNWTAVIGELAVDDKERESIVRSMLEFLPVVEQLPELAQQVGVDQEIIDQCRKSIDSQADQLAALKGLLRG